MKRAVTFICLAVLAFGASEALRRVRFVSSAEEVSIDLRQRFFAPATAPDPGIVIVALDEETMQTLPFRSPIPRTFLSTLHQTLAAARPRLIAYDLFFKDPSFPADDEKFTSALRAFPPYAVSLGRDGPGGVVLEDLPREEFRRRLAGVGLADLPLNPFSQVVRRAKVSYETPSGPRPTFAGLLYQVLAGHEATKHLMTTSRKFFGFAFPIVDEAGAMVIRYLRPVPASARPVVPTYSARLVATGQLPTEWFADRIVLVGATFGDAQDAFLTPFYSATYGYRRVPGVEIHAQILGGLLSGQFYGLFSPPQERLFVALCILLIAGLAFWGRPWRLFASLPIVCGLLISADILGFRKFGLIIPLVLPLATVVATYGSVLAWRMLAEGQQRRWLRATFAKYVAPQVVDELVRHPERVCLGGELREITCLFSDIQNFTTLSERLDPASVVAFLNDYLDEMSRAILDHNGTIDKYEGDAVMAFFGAPVASPEHARQAVFAAHAMQRASSRLSERWASRLGQLVVTRIGVHSGEAVVGNIGSESRFDYTAIGDTVNVASRLEGINKEYGTHIIISEATRRYLSPETPVRPLGVVRPKGKEKGLSIFEAIIS